jgi:hypothetical protein
MHRIHNTLMIPTRTQPFSLLLLCLAVALVPSKASGWTCDSVCNANQRDCLEWKKNHCPDDSRSPARQPSSPSGIHFFNSPGPPQEAMPMPAPPQGLSLPDVRASRIFSGPGQYPPSEFAAYGIVAFQATSADAKETARYVRICKGFLASIPAASALLKQGIPMKEQMATVWPITDERLATSLNSTANTENRLCEKIVASTNFLASHDAIHKARKITRAPSLSGRGPYLIAWSPATTFGKPEAAVLVLDLSNVTTSEGATAIFNEWADKIEMNPQLWKGGWDLKSLKTSIKVWADRWGADVLAILSPTAK